MTAPVYGTALFKYISVQNVVHALRIITRRRNAKDEINSDESAVRPDTAIPNSTVAEIISPYTWRKEQKRTVIMEK